MSRTIPVLVLNTPKNKYSNVKHFVFRMNTFGNHREYHQLILGSQLVALLKLNFSVFSHINKEEIPENVEYIYRYDGVNWVSSEAQAITDKHDVYLVNKHGEQPVVLVVPAGSKIGYPTSY